MNFCTPLCTSFFIYAIMLCFPEFWLLHFCRFFFVPIELHVLKNDSWNTCRFVFYSDMLFLRVQLFHDDWLVCAQCTSLGKLITSFCLENVSAAYFFYILGQVSEFLQLLSRIEMRTVRENPRYGTVREIKMVPCGTVNLHDYIIHSLVHGVYMFTMD